MANMPENYIDATITSPPYDNLRNYNGFTWNSGSVATALFRITKPGGVVVWVVNDATIKGSESGNSFRQALTFISAGFNLHDTMIYQKTGTPFPSQGRYNNVFEYMFVFSKSKPKTFNPILKKNITAGAVRHSRKFRQANGEMKDGFNGKAVKEYGIENNIWVIQNGMFKSSKDKIAFEHPAIFPEELVRRHITTWTNANDIVYDPFMGSGTTAVIAKKNNRNYIGSEISKEYCDIINARLTPTENLFFN